MLGSATMALSAPTGARQARAASAAASLATTSVSELRARPAARQARGRARRVEAFGWGMSSSLDGTYERVLRYPDGKERRIRFPLPPPTQELQEEDVTDGCWATECWVPREQHWGGPALQRGGAMAVASPPAPQAPSPDLWPPTPEPERTRMPSSPMELLRFLNSPEHKAAQEQLWARVRASYEIVSEVPWVAPKPLYLLTQQQPLGSTDNTDDAAPGQTYMLRTRVSHADQEAELSAVLGRGRPDGSPLIRCSEMKDGVVAFLEEADAERYGHMLEAEGLGEVSVARCDSHALFRSVQDVRAVVVLLRGGGDALLPQPHQLATSLRSQAEEGGSAGGAGPLFD